MKKVLLSAIAVFSLTFANAQEEEKGTGMGFGKGDLFMSGALSIGSQKTGDVKANGFEIEPKIGYFVSENIAIGGKIGYASMKAENAGVDTNDMSALSLGAFGRYYFTPASQFSLFGELGVDYSTIDDNLADVQQKELGLGLGLGLNYFVSDNWSIEATWAGLGYTSNDNGGNGAEKTNSFGLGGDLRAISFGVNYKF
ncbi:outer membrane beta-barrel protein [Flavobacterium urocaniciphilum]|uniref:Outer membrane protein n=1 Tax=Flavobacterium urocaniciphilum TaxID=1299341 RepID=A0A1H9E845_9FLAO|nr:outer membrane beta-barrel protein [Flavobacterium urocaniciphilum]SEQ21900.1 outer membrane protein [Flavobacterium urocaniciphilum]